MNTRKIDNIDKCALCGREDVTDDNSITRWTTEDGYSVDISASLYVFALAETSLGRIYICEHCYSDYHFREFTKQDMAEIHYQFGLEYGMIDDYKKSLYSLLKSMEIKNDCPKILASVGYCYNKLGDKEKSREYYFKALSIDPNNFMANENLKQLN